MTKVLWWPSVSSEGLFCTWKMNLTNIQTRYVVEVEFTRCTLKEQLHIKWHKSSIWWWLQWWWWRLNFSPIFFPLYNLQTWIICARLTSASYNAIFLLQSGGQVDCLNFLGDLYLTKVQSIFSPVTHWLAYCWLLHLTDYFVPWSCLGLAGSRSSRFCLILAKCIW